MTQGTLQINTEKLLPIIKKWLYSDKEIFLRELVSNACDALSKLKILREQKETDFDEAELKIEITLDKEKKTLTISDTGIGMSAAEVEKYIAQLAFSGAEDFLSKYEGSQEKDQVIGHFGLGFYSAYMVSSKVEIDTLSYRKDEESAFWSCDGGASYTLEKGTRKERGTTITLFLEDDEFLDESKIRSLLVKYCSFLPYPIFLGEDKINKEEPLYLKAASDCTDEEYLEFYRQLHPLEPDPLFWVHLSVDYPFRLKGILYFPKVGSSFDYGKNHLQLFCNRVYVSSNCQDLIPDYLNALRGAIDSPDIPLNVSRSALQMDGVVRSLSTHISKKVADRLATIYRTDKEKFYSHFQDIETILKLGALQDEKFFERIKEFLVFRNLNDEWMTVPTYLEKSPEKVYYTNDPDSPFLELYKEKGLDVLIANGPIDTPLIGFLEQKFTPAKFQRVDGGIDDSMLDPNQEDKGSEIVEFVRESLGISDLEVEAKSLANDTLPALLIFDEGLRRMRDTMKLHGQPLPPGLGDKKTLVLNLKSPLIAGLQKQKDKELAKEVVQQLYQLSLLSQRELPEAELPSLIKRSCSALERLLHL